MSPRGSNGLLRVLFSALLLSGALLLAPLGALAAGPGQDNNTPDVTVTLDHTRVTVGDPLTVTVVVKHAANITIDTTSIDDQLIDLPDRSVLPQAVLEGERSKADNP